MEIALEPAMPTYRSGLGMLLDADLPENSKWDRALTQRLPPRAWDSN